MENTVTVDWEIFIDSYFHQHKLPSLNNCITVKKSQSIVCYMYVYTQVLVVSVCITWYIL